MVQTAFALSAIRESVQIVEERPDFEVHTYKALGDRYRNEWAEKMKTLSLDERRRKWTYELELAVDSMTVELAVHSGKDLPVPIFPGTAYYPILQREDPRDVFISADGTRLMDMPPGARIGTTSLRRIAQLRWLRPDLVVERNYSGNVTTRLDPAHMRSRNVAGVIVAAAGVHRLQGFLNLPDLRSRMDYLPVDLMTPAASQGILVLQARREDVSIQKLLPACTDTNTLHAWYAERKVVELLKGDCGSSIGVHASFAAEDGSEAMIIRARVLNSTGSIAVQALAQGKPQEYMQLAAEVANQLLSQGAGSLINHPSPGTN